MTHKRTKRLIVRLSEQELALLNAKAEASGITLSSLVRDHIDQVRVHNHADKERWLRTVSAMENSITALGKASAALSPVDAVGVLSYLAAIHRYLERLDKENINNVSEVFPPRVGQQ